MKISRLYPAFLFLGLPVLISIHLAAGGAVLLAAMSPGGVPLGRFALGGRGPSRVAVDPQGRFYVSDPEGRRIFVTDARGQTIVPIKVNAYPLGIAVASDGRIFLGDADRHAVHAFDSSGNYLFALGSGEGEFERPIDIALDEVQGRIYVADGEANQIKVYDLGGFPLLNITSTGTGPLNFPTGVAVDRSSGNVVVSDHNNAKLQVFNGQGLWMQSIGRLTSPAGLCIDNLGLIYVAEAFQGRVLAFAPDGTSRPYVGEFGQGPGELRTPTDATLDPFGRLAVVSYNNRALELYGPPGYSDPPLTVPPPQLLHLRLPGEGPAVVGGTVEFDPSVLRTSSGGRWLKAFVELEDGTAGEIDLTSVVLNNQIPASRSEGNLSDKDGDGLPELTLFFERRAVLSILISSAQSGPSNERSTDGPPNLHRRTSSGDAGVEKLVRTRAGSKLLDSNFLYEMVVSGRVRDVTFEVRGPIEVLATGTGALLNHWGSQQ